MDPRNRNEAICNLPKEEVSALAELIRLQREREIIINPCDKGAGILILDFRECMKVCYEYLLSTQSNNKAYYQEVDDLELERVKIKITHVLKEALNNKDITDEEFKAMDPEDKNASKFYCNFKIHKEHTPMQAPPPRPIISGSGSITENLGVFVENQIRETRRYGLLRGPTSSSCGGLWPSAEAFFALRAKKELFMLFWPIFGVQ